MDVMAGLAGVDGDKVRTLLHDLSNSLTLISVLTGLLDEMVEPGGKSIVESLEKAAEDAAATIESLRGALGVDAG
jgi:hypothetical protein